MPDADGKIRGIALGGRAAEAWLRIFGQREEPLLFDEEEVERVRKLNENPPLGGRYYPRMRREQE